LSLSARVVLPHRDPVLDFASSLATAGPSWTHHRLPTATAEEAKEKLREIVEGFFFRWLRSEDGKRIERLLIKSPLGYGWWPTCGKSAHAGG
jgi:hypothetical protein